ERHPQLLLVHVFVATRFTGEPTETDEMTPQWFSVDGGEPGLPSIPYDSMWADDRIWLPLVLTGASVEGYFLFSGESLVKHELTRREASFDADAALQRPVSVPQGAIAIDLQPLA